MNLAYNESVMPHTLSKTVYTFDELTETAKDKAIAEHSEFCGEVWDAEFTFDDFVTIAEIIGIEFRYHDVTLMSGAKKQKPNIWYSGFWSQGDGACFEGTYRYKKGAAKAIREYAGTDTELHRIADELQALQRKAFYGLTATMTHKGHYYHAYCMSVDVEHAWDDTYNYEERSVPTDDVTELMRDLANWLYRALEKEYEWQTSREQVIESIQANEYDFNEDGSIAT